MCITDERRKLKIERTIDTHVNNHLKLEKISTYFLLCCKEEFVFHR